MRTLLGMQYGGGVPQQLQDGGVSSGLAYLRRGKARKKAYDKARDEEGRLIEKRKKGGFWGSLGGLGGGLLGAALVGSGLGIPLALAAGLGTAGGRYLGSKAGYGKDFEVEDDVMYGEEAGLGDIGAAGESYESGMGQEAILSGVKAGLMAGISPGGGIYGKTSKWAEGLRGTEGILPMADAVTTDTGAIFDEATGMYGDVPVEELSFGLDDYSNLPTPPPPPISLRPDTSIPSAGLDANELDVFDKEYAVGMTPNLDMEGLEFPDYSEMIESQKNIRGLLDRQRKFKDISKYWDNYINQNQPQIANFSGGGGVLKNPRTLLGFVG